MSNDDEYFGSPDQVALMKRSRALWLLLQDNPRYSYYGRLVGLSDPAEDTVEVLYALAKLQGATCCYFYPASAASSLFAELETSGLTTDRHEHYWGGVGALAASRQVQEDHKLPFDLTVSIVDTQTPEKMVSDIAELSQACDVMPVPGSIMRGQVRKGLCLVAIDQNGNVVATASSYINHHPSSPRANDVFWGMLATRQDRRGERIALLLGAQAIIHMWENHGARGFMTGVRANNPSSQALCNKLGVGASEWVYASCINKELHSGGAITK